ncbi:MAG: hypothetical protein K0U38_03120 [Epsilonproteobacteria bacterium]|nr:hypothetical protein [Campylobacterota bacterium]
MGQKDVISKEILKHIAQDISKHILHIEIKDNMELINQNHTRIESRDSDLLFKNGDEVVHIEVQNDNDTKMHLRMHRYLSDILFQHEFRTIKQYMLYIGKAKCNMKSTIQMDNLDYKYAIIDMRDLPCESFLQSDDPSALVLAMLCDFEKRDSQMVVNTILRRLRELNSEKEYRNYLKMVNVYSTNRGLEKEVEKGVEMLTVDIEKTPFYKIGVERGIEQGVEKGKLEMAIEFIKEFNLSVDAVIEKFKLNKEEFLNALKEYDLKTK